MQANPNFSRTVRIVSLGCAIAILVLAGMRAITHLNDLTGIHHIAGIWMALAKYCNDGVLYPPLESEGVYAGTRYVPVCFGLIAGLVKITGDYVTAAKGMALGSMVLLLGGVFFAVRRATGRWLDALALTGLVMVSPEALTALLSPHADALAAALTVVGLLLIERGTISAGRTGLAAALFTAALLTKFSSVAGPAAAGVYLLRRDRSGALGLFGLWLVLSASSLLLLNHFSDGRFADNFRSLGSGGMSFDSIRIGPARVAYALGQTLPFALIVPLAMLTIWRRSRESGFSLWDWYFLFMAGVTAIIFTSPGTGINHLLELEIAAVLVVAQALVRPNEMVARLVALAVLVAGGYTAIKDYRDTDDAAVIPSRVVVEVLPADSRILAEDATAPILLGQRPVVMDAFAFRVLAERGRVDDRQLADRVTRQEFDVLVMMGRVDHPEESLCPRFHFGPRVTRAMREAYRFDRQIGPYYLFVPMTRTDLGSHQ
jgi:hypothetical protein